MDISVSLLNKRMAVRLPAEFPLGLVFVTGLVTGLHHTADGNQDFFLLDGEHQLRCRLSTFEAENVALKEGDHIRAGGHLAFDSARADYFLLARDVSVQAEQSTQNKRRQMAIAPILADIQKRSQAARLAPAELPGWVKEIAPPELQANLEEAALAENDQEKDLETAPDSSGNARPVPAESEPVAAEEPEEDETDEEMPGGFTNDLVEFLSEAMDSPEDVELTPEMMVELAPAIQPGSKPFRAAKPYDVTNIERSDSLSLTAVILILLVIFLILLAISYLAISALQGGI